MIIKKYNLALMFGAVSLFAFTCLCYYYSILTGGIGTSPIVFSGDDGVMYHNVAIGLESVSNDFFWVEVIQFLYFIFFSDPIVVRFFLFSCFSLVLFYMVVMNKKFSDELSLNSNVADFIRYDFFYNKMYWVVFFLFLFSPSVFIFQYMSIYRDGVIGGAFFLAVIFFLRRKYWVFSFFCMVVFLFRPYMLASMLVAICCIFFVGVNNFFRVLFFNIIVFSMAVLAIPVVAMVTSFDLILFRNIFVDYGANSTFGLNFTGGNFFNVCIYFYSLILNFSAGIPITIYNPLYWLFFVVQTLPCIYIYRRVFSGCNVFMVNERKMLVFLLSWIMMYSLMNDNAGNSLRMFSVGVPILLFVSIRLLSISYFFKSKYRFLS